jgi:uncharacterized protein
MLRSGAVLAAHSSWCSLLLGCSGKSGSVVSANSLLPCRDASTGLPLLQLPPGFKYFSFAWKDQPLSTGELIPGAADGMAVVSQRGHVVTLVRNHEIWADVGAYSRLITPYDPGAGGGTVVIEVDLLQQRMLSAKPGLVGTAANCSGGHLPDGHWLSCEELVHVPGTETRNYDGSIANRFTKPHGFVFEGGPKASIEPLVAMGQFRHEGVAMDPSTNTLYLTEDHKPAGLYRFTPKNAQDLHQGGHLDVMQVMGERDLRKSAAVGKKYKVRWIRIENPLAGHSPNSTDQGGVIQQGIALGATQFTRLEGIYYHDGLIYFNSTDGGPAEAGQIFKYSPQREELEIIYCSPSVLTMDYPDQMCHGPQNGSFIAQDSKRVNEQVLWWLSPDAKPNVLAINNVELDGKTYRDAEWSGLCMSADKQWLFANIYTPGFTVAITGPWQKWFASL